MKAVEAVQPMQARLVRQLLQPTPEEPLLARQLLLVHRVLAFALLQALQHHATPRPRVIYIVPFSPSLRHF